ncbi:PqqD family peptide modification chaperone [Rhabdothermincola salaria]|uniref:PqqD family peptide modification chaperone n=1 Tax=Rhabdothermincola salaria TaxID=2903142 RepID=UPI001E4ACD07|nr:PqqD family peptide modification chaperone [Rhabdothermincola salaria]MCD9623240.1 PqqD family protein [Rhabdothermincola salaria]
MPQQIRIEPAVNHERLDDEVIAINIESGVYFAMDDAAADCWTVAVDGGGIDEMVGVLTILYDVDEERARADAAAFVATLVDQRLARLAGDRPVAIALPDPPPSGRRRYAPPELQGFDDLEELLLIDPIHEVDDAGWPLPVQGDGA